jgi:hypothetical protein
VAQKELDTAVGQIRHAFERLNSKSTEANVDFENMAVNILEPMRANLSEANFARIVDRLRGAMVGFCQRDEAKAQFDAEPSSLQQAGQGETLQPQQKGQSEPDTAEPWWDTSEEVTLGLHGDSSAMELTHQDMIAAALPGGAADIASR